MATQSSYANTSLKPKLGLPSQCSSYKPFSQISALVKPKSSFPYLSCSASSSSSDPVVIDSEPPALDSAASLQRRKLGVVVKPLQKPRLVLKFIWMQKDIGIALDQMIPGYGTIPLSPYYFWPRKDAWEELKVLLENKPWISEMQRIHLLNQATDIINLWQASGGDLP